MTEQEIIALAYDNGAEDEYNRLEESVMGEAEFSLVTELLTEYITEGSSVIDIGAGPGRYAEFLLSRNCEVGTIDLSERSLNLYKARINGNYGTQVLFSKKACATQLNWINSNSADAVLLMGPLYHLTSEKERELAVEHAYRILKPKGVIFAIFMSPYPKLNPLMETNAEMLLDQNYLNSMQNNCITNVLFKGIPIEQYRCWPAECKRLMEKQGFDTERIRNIEGIGEFLSIKMKNGYTQNEKEKLINTMRNTCENPNLIGITSQYLYLGRKPF
jgi:ubiquinone/menaquinone biosynthesis C-methylase UbiE